MPKIIPHLWFDREAKEAAALYASIFKNSKVKDIVTIHNTPSGDANIITFNLANQEFMAINAGPIFKFNPSISLFAVFHNKKEIDEAWKKLVQGGEVRMEYKEYPWSESYGWLSDRYGLSWQLSLSEDQKIPQIITPLLMFTQDKAGKAKEAMEFYTKIFPDSKIEMVAEYEKGEGDEAGYIKHSRFKLAGYNLMAMDSSLKHDFNFNEAISLVVNCETQKEIDYYWEKLSAFPENEQCGWLKDKYGVSWQIVPRVMGEMMTSGNEEKIGRLTEAFLKMKKFDIQTLKQAYEGK